MYIQNPHTPNNNNILDAIEPNSIMNNNNVYESINEKCIQINRI